MRLSTPSAEVGVLFQLQNPSWLCPPESLALLVAACTRRVNVTYTGAQWCHHQVFFWMN